MANNLNIAGVTLIKSFESCSLTVYHEANDAPDVWTQGWGHTNGITEDSPPITQDQADSWLLDDLATTRSQIDVFLQVELSDNQYSALVSLVFNCGIAPLNGHLGTYLNQSDFDNVAVEWLKWDHDGGMVIEGLARRRRAELALFQS